MQDPYNYPFIQKDNTMYLSTISTIRLKQLKTISAYVQIFLVTHHFNAETFKARYQNRPYQKEKRQQISPYPLT